MHIYLTNDLTMILGLRIINIGVYVNDTAYFFHVNHQ